MILKLFSDEDAYEFLKRNPSFLSLRVDAVAELGTTSFGLAARGLARTQAQGWRSSAFEDPMPIQRIASDIIDSIKTTGG